MSLSIALIVALQAIAPVAVEDEIVVIGRQFQQASVIVGKDAQGRTTCGLGISSGNVRLDERLCRTAAKCVTKGATSDAAVKACIDSKKPDLFSDFHREYLKGQR